MALKETLLTDRDAIEQVFAEMNTIERELVSTLIVLEDGEVPAFLNCLIPILATTLVRLERLEQFIKADGVQH